MRSWAMANAAASAAQPPKQQRHQQHYYSTCPPRALTREVPEEPAAARMPVREVAADLVLVAATLPAVMVKVSVADLAVEVPCGLRMQGIY